MTPSARAFVVIIALVAAMSGYALFAGADLGSGVWDLIAGAIDPDHRARVAIKRSTSVVWEANNVWIVFGLVVFWTGFSSGFADVMRVLFVPLSISLLGIVLRATGFAFHQELARLPGQRLIAVVFAGAALLPPFFLGAVVGAVVTGQVRPGQTSEPVAAWTGLTPVLTGLLFLSMAMFIAAVYLVGDSERRGEPDNAAYFTRRGLVMGGVTGALALGALAALHSDAPYVFHRLLHTSYPLVIVSALSGVGAAALLATKRRPELLRPVAGLAVAAVIAAWAWAQYPYLLPTSLTIKAASSTATALDAQIVVVVIAVLLVAPSFVVLYTLQQRDMLSEHPSPSSLRRELRAEEGTTPSPPQHGVLRHLLTRAAVGFAVVSMVRTLSRREQP